MNGHLEQLKKNISVIGSSVVLTVGLIFGAGSAWQKLTGTSYLSAETFSTYKESHDEAHVAQKELLTVKLEYIRKVLDRIEAHHIADHD